MKIREGQPKSSGKIVKSFLGPIIKKYSKLFLSMILVSSLGIALMVGLTSSAKTLETSLQQYINDYKYADMIVTTDATDFDTVKKIEALDDVYKVDPKLVIDASVRINGTRNIAVRAFSFDIKKWEEFYFWEIAENADYMNVAVDYRFARSNDLHAGDLLEIKFDKEFETVCIGYLVSAPDCIGSARDQYSWGENKDFGYFFVPYNLTYGSDFYGTVNQFCITKEDWVESDEAVLVEVEDLLKKEDVDVILSFTYDNSPVHAKVIANVDPIKTVSVIMPVVFYIIAIGVICLFLSQIISQQRRDIGILRALGFANREIIGLYSMVTLIISILGCILGLVFANILLIYINSVFKNYFPLPYMTVCVDYVYIVIAIICTVVCGQLAVFLSTRKVTRIMPTEAMTRSSNSVTKMPSWLSKSETKFGTEFKYGLSSIFKNKRRFLITTLCVSFSFMMILTSLAFDSSSDYIIESYYDYRTTYDAEAFFRDKPTQDIIDGYYRIDGVSSVENLAYSMEEFSFGDTTLTNTICGIPTENMLIGIYDPDGNKIAVPENGIVLDSFRADELGVEIGDVIKLSGTELEVVNIVKQSVAKLSYVSLDTLERCCEPAQYTLLIKGGNQEDLLNYGLDNPSSYKYTSFSDILREGNIEHLKLTSAVIYVLIVFGVIMGFLIVYNTTRSNLFEQQKEVSVLRSLGFQISQISLMWFVQTGVEYVIASVVGMLSGKLIVVKTLELMGDETRTYLYHTTPWQIFAVLGIVLAYVLFSHIMALRGISKWNLVENIKERE